MRIAARFHLRYGAFSLEVDLDLPAKGVIALFGHSGSGKTTLLRCMAGLERAREARFVVKGQTWQDDACDIFLPVHRRPIGYVFQEANLFPHLTVQQNLAYGWRRVASARRQVAFEEAVSLLGAEKLLQRRIENLSGGERQRIAMARALLTSPQLLLMDEPLAALDLQSKYEILPYLERLHDELAIPVIYVTHAPEEVTRFADYIVLLDQGRVQGAAPVNQILTALDLPLAHRDEAGVIIEASVAAHDDHYELTRLDFAGGALWVARLPRNLGARVRARIPARDVSLALVEPRDTSILNVLRAQVCSVTHDEPGRALISLDIAGQPLLARITHKSAITLGLKPGLEVYAQIKGVSLLR
jgi:molybdate transport system ATP-binding protein